MTMLPTWPGVRLERRGRLLAITLDRPDRLNAIDRALHDALPDVLDFATNDSDSDVILLTGAGRAFSAGGDLDHMERNAREPELFDHEARQARRIVHAMLDLDKPVVCRMNGHAVGLGATLALLCDIIIATEDARIGDPHVGIGLVAGDGGAIIWAQRIGIGRAKDYLLSGRLIAAPEAAAIGLINRAVPASQLDAEADACCQMLLSGAQAAIRATKRLTNIELRRIATAVMDAGIALEQLSVRSADHREGLAALRERRAPRFGKDPA